MSAIKFRIVKKEKDGITLSPAKGADSVKMGWKEFEENYTVKEDIWAVPSAEIIKKMDDANEHISNAATAFIMSGGLKGTPTDVVQLAVLGEEVQKVQEILGCSNAEVLMLVRQRIDAIANFGQKPAHKNKKHHNKPKNNSPKSTPVEKKESGYAILADNPALLELKKKMEK